LGILCNSIGVSLPGNSGSAKKQLNAGDLAKATWRRCRTRIGQDGNQKIKIGDAASYSSNVQCFCEFRLAATLTGITRKKSCCEPIATSHLIADQYQLC